MTHDTADRPVAVVVLGGPAAAVEGASAVVVTGDDAAACGELARRLEPSRRVAVFTPLPRTAGDARALVEFVHEMFRRLDVVVPGATPLDRDVVDVLCEAGAAVSGAQR